MAILLKKGLYGNTPMEISHIGKTYYFYKTRLNKREAHKWAKSLEKHGFKVLIVPISKKSAKYDFKKRKVIFPKSNKIVEYAIYSKI